MSLTINQEYHSWEVVLAMLRRIETTWRGAPLSRLDHASYTEAILMWGMILSDLALRYTGLGRPSDHYSMMRSLASSDVADVASFVSEAITMWRHCSVHPQVMTYTGFKRQCAKILPCAGDILGPIRGAIVKHLECPTPDTFYPVYQVLSFLNHLSLRDIDMSLELEMVYRKKEEDLDQLRVPDWLIHRMNHIMVDWFRDFRIDSQEFIPGHGPGAVAELRGDTSKISKYRLLKPDTLIEYVFRKYAGLEASSCVPLEYGDVRTTRTSAIVFVPKSMKTKRVISKEPATLMYFQQGVDRCIRKYISKHSYLSHRIDLRDQSIQGRMACQASRTGRFATVDLSAASDSIQYDLVKGVFASTPLYPFLVALRSRSTVLPSGEEVRMAKYAPMGSSLTFPIETLIFACLCELTEHYVYHGTGVKKFTYRVYGDDIIIPVDCLVDLESNLRLCGFTLNEDKTYGSPYRFRESCGVDSYDGVVVTPLRISRKFSAEEVTTFTPDSFSRTIDMANQCHAFGFRLLRGYLIKKLMRHKSTIPLFSEDPDRGVYSPQPTNFRVPSRYNEDLQTWEVYVADTKTVCSFDGSQIFWNPKKRRYYLGGEPPVDAGCIGLFEWLRNASNSVTDPHGPARCGMTWSDFFDQFTSRSEQHRSSIGSSKTNLVRQWRYDPLSR